MNRIRELREARGLSPAQLAKLVGTTQPTINRLERGKRKLTESWMRRIAQALKVRPADLIATATLAEFEDEVEFYVPEGMEEIAAAMSARNLVYMRVMTDAVEQTGYGAGKTILVDRSEDAARAIEAGDVVVVEVHPPSSPLSPVRLLRQYLAPALLTTNRLGTNTSFLLHTRDFIAIIRGVVVRKRAEEVRA